MSSGSGTSTVDGIVVPGPPYSTPSLEANLILRVVLGILALFGCWVPMRLLWKNGELAATVFCLVLMISNFLFVVNALIWRDDNVAEWWEGQGWCDLQVYLWTGLDTIFPAAIFEIMRGLASKVSLSRATSLSAKEKRRESIISVLVIFSIPVIQIALHYPLTNARYYVATLTGCLTRLDNSWPTLVFLHLPGPILTVAAAVMGVLAFVRYYGFDRSQRQALGSSSNASISSRQQKVRRKLYFMCACILLPYLPINITFLVFRVIEGMPWTKVYDFNKLHYGDGSWPYPQDTTWPLTSGDVDANVLLTNYIPIVATVPILILFGVTAEAINEYRKYARFLGLGRLFPSLYEEYNEHRGSRKASTANSNSTMICGLYNSQMGRDIELGPSDTNSWPDREREGNGPQLHRSLQWLPASFTAPPRIPAIRLPRFGRGNKTNNTSNATDGDVLHGFKEVHFDEQKKAFVEEIHLDAEKGNGGACKTRD